MENVLKKLKGKKALSVLLVLIMVLAVCSPAFSPVVAKAANTYPVELGFNNLFIFEEWASDKNSTTVVGANTDSTLEADVANGSFTITKKSATSGDYHQVYTGHGMDKTNAISNTDYYQMSVEPNTTYSLSYTLGGSVTPKEFFTTVFMFDSQNLCLTWVNDYANYAGENHFVFTTPAGTNLLQIRFGIENSGTPNAKVSNISLTECDVITDSAANLFNFDSWASNKNGTTVGYSGMVYADGSVQTNTTSDIITMNLNANGSLFTGFSLDTTSGYYTIAVNPNSYYILNYNLVNSLSTAFKQFTPYVVTVSNSGAINYMELSSAIDYGQSSCVFTTGSDTAYIYPVFTMGSSSTNWTVAVKDIELLAAEVDENKMSPNRLVKTYGEDATYGELPTVTPPDNYIFAGWNTEADGTGMRIAADTPVQPMSLTVYPKFEPAVDSLTVKTQPTKTIYTVGEKLDTTGLVLEASITSDDVTNTFEVSSGYYCTPEVLNTVGTQTITANYGGKTTTFTVTVKDGDPGIIIVNGASKDVTITNNEYTFNYSTSAFNRYEVTYKSDSYVSGVVTFNDGKTEEFFLEPSDNGSFGSYVDRLFEGNTYNQIVKIKFTTLDKDNGHFELVSLKTVNNGTPDETISFTNNRTYEMGISLKNGGVVSELYDLSNDVVARTYNTTFNGSSVTQTRVDTEEMFNSGIYNNEGTYTGTQSNRVNLINTYDAGRYLQQSYYGTGDKPYVESEYNNAEWPYNPVQGGNAVKEASKIIDYKITEDYVYIKARPLDWAKWSDEYAENANRTGYEAIWGDDYITDTYVEAWYYFQDDIIKVNNRKVDYSGLPEAGHSQEYPALYLIEPLNHFVYNNVSAENAWANDSCETQKNVDYVLPKDGTSTYWNIKDQIESGKLMNIEEPEYWGLVEMYKDKFEIKNYEPWVDANENWAAFTASENPNSYGVGLYTDTTTKFYYGIQPEIYQQKAGDSEGSVGEVTNNPAYRHAQTINPTSELATSYIAPTDNATFRSYEPTEFTYYLATGTTEEIREDFKDVSKAEEERAKPKIAVPETVYLNPANNTDGQYYVNNVMNKNNYYNLEPTTEKDYMYLGFHAEGAEHFSVNITNVTDSGNDPFVGNHVNDKTTKYDNGIFDFTDGTVVFDFALLGLHLSNPLNPGEKNTVKWDITFYYGDANDPNTRKETYTAYTVMYAPGRTVGAVAEARQVSASQHEVSSWITGANGVDHSQTAPLGTLHGDYKAAGYFKNDPLIYPDGFGITGSGGSADDYINAAITGVDVDNNVYSENTFVMQTATNDHDSSRAQSYLGLLKIDESRYTNTDQIPNLRIGYDALRIGSYTNNSLGKYNTYVTVGDELSYTSASLSEAPNGWTSYSSYTNIAGDGGKTLPYRESFVPSYKVSGLDGKYLHAIAQGTADQTINPNQYSTAGTSVLISLTDKSALRDSVTDGYGVQNPTDEFLDILEEAATILGDPSASQEDIDRINDSLNEQLSIFYSLKYDNLFSVYEFSQHSENMKVTNNGTASYSDKTLTVVNGEITGAEAYTRYGSADSYYKVDLEPNTEYVFEYDVTTDVKSQAFMFFYNSNNANSEAPTNISVQTNGGAWQTKNESNSWWGNYGSAGTYHYVIKFTTGATTTQAGFRFGNTTNDPCTSTFSNIKLIDAERYYADATYEKTEDVYEEYAYYGTLQTPVRLGYTFNGWFDANGNEVTAIDSASEHKSIFSQWSITNYTITYDANGGKVSPASQTYTIETQLNIPTPTREGYTFQGWTVTVADGNWEFNGMCSPGEVPVKMYGNVTLTAQWVISEVNVTFDNLIDLSQWKKLTPSNASAAFTDTAITLTSNNGVGEGTFTSPYFEVAPGKEYKIDMDITGDNWDVYIFFCDANGNWVDFTDSGNRFASSGHNPDRVFTAPNKSTVVKAQIRIDANGSSNTVKFDNIRVWENTGIEVSPVNKVVEGGTEYGELPTPVREGYKFEGWENAEGQRVNAEDIVNSSETVNLYSQWTEKEYGIFFSANGGDGDYAGMSVKYTQDFVLYDGLTATGATFIGWSTEQYAVKPDFEGGKTINVSQIEGFDANNNESVTLYAVWELSEDCVSDDSVVSDFGLAMTINPFGNDAGIFGYHAFDVAKSYEYGFSTDSGATITSSATGDYGIFALDKDNFTVIYTPTKVALGADEITLYTKLTYRDDTVKIVSNTIEIVPSSNILYEENYMNDGAAGAVNWVKDGTTKTDYQTLSDNSAVVYGYDDVYADGTNTHSYGSADKATVSSTAKRSTTKTFNFIGEGIDLVSACGANTGIMIVKISGGNLKSPKAYIVDTYYGDNDVSGLICQTPIVSFRGDYGTYTIEATAAYLSGAGALNKKSITGSIFANGKLSTTTAVPVDEAAAKAMIADLGIDLGNADLEMVWFDDNSILNGGTGAKGNVKKNRAGETTTSLDCYLDGFRVYHPMGYANDNYIATEKDAYYFNVIDSLNKNQIGSGTTSIDTLAYVTGSFNAGEDGTVPTLSFANYQQVGPQNELYLKSGAGDALVLMVGVGTNSTVQLGLRAVSGTATVKIGNKQFNINSATEMYYDITDCVEVKDGIATITIQNSGSGILAVNNIKLTGDTTAVSVVGEEVLEYATASMVAPAENVAVINGVVTPIVEDDTIEPDNGGDDVTVGGDTNTTEPDNGDNTTTDDNTTTGTGSFLEQLFAMLMEIFKSLFNFLPVEEVM